MRHRKLESKINLNNIMVYDFETGSRNKNKAQVTQLAALIVDPIKLAIISGSEFNSEVKPILDDEKAKEMGLDPVEEEALKITHKTRGSLAVAPELKKVWGLFVDYVNNWKTGPGNSFKAPIRAGFNIINYDNPIMDRLALEFGPWDTTWGTQDLCHPIHNIDVMQDVFRITENIRINNTNSISLDSVRDWLGMEKSGAHDAMNDVYDTAEIMIRFLKMYRKLNTGITCVGCSKNNRIKFEGALANWKRGR